MLVSDMHPVAILSAGSVLSVVCSCLCLMLIFGVDVHGECDVVYL